MTAEHVKQVIWRISASNPAHALRTLQDADNTLTKRLHNLNGANVDQWPGYEIRIHVEAAPRLFADSRHGDGIYTLAQKILRHGLRAGIRLEIQW